MSTRPRRPYPAISAHPLWRPLALAFALVALSLLAAGMARAVPISGDGDYTALGASGERTIAHIIATIEADDGISLRRVEDSLDQLWQLTPDALALGRARYAGYDSTFGLLPGTTGGEIIELMSLDHGYGTGDAVSLVGVGLGLEDFFRPAIRTPGGALYSALEADNADGADHMVTWVNTLDPLHYFVAFEDLPYPGADGDFNDMVIELRGVIDGPLAMPEPSMVSLLGISLVALGLARRRSR